MRHCPECRTAYPERVDVCPECWATLVAGFPPAVAGLCCVVEAASPYEADMLEALLRDEGIPCLRVAGHGALPWALAGVPVSTTVRLFVRADMADAAAALLDEVTGGPEAAP